MHKLVSVTVDSITGIDKLYKYRDILCYEAILTLPSGRVPSLQARSIGRIGRDLRHSLRWKKKRRRRTRATVAWQKLRHAYHP